MNADNNAEAGRCWCVYRTNLLIILMPPTTNLTNLINLLMLTMLTNQPAKAVDDNKQPAILCCTSAIVFLFLASIFFLNFPKASLSWNFK